MDFEVEPRKRKELPTNKATDGTTVIIPTRLSRQQAKTRDQEAVLQKNQKTKNKNK